MAKIKNDFSLYVNFRVLFLSLVSAAICLWLLPSPFIVYSEEFQKNNTPVAGLEPSSVGFHLKYAFLKTKDQHCKEDKKNKRDSLLCGQSIQPDEQEELEYEKMMQPTQTKPGIRSREQGPITKASGTIIRRPLVQKISCAEKNDHPSYSDSKGKHMDEDCCPDPDEWPKPGCTYSPSGRALMLKGPK